MSKTLGEKKARTCQANTETLQNKKKNTQRMRYIAMNNNVLVSWIQNMVLLYGAVHYKLCKEAMTLYCLQWDLPNCRGEWRNTFVFKWIISVKLFAFVTYICYRYSYIYTHKAIARCSILFTLKKQDKRIVSTL